MSGKCFYPNGTVSRGGFPCSNQTQSYSACCGLNQYCASNGLCLAQDMTIFRGACTDKTWASVQCPKICVEEAPSSLAPVVPCGGGKYSCGGGCGNNGKIITLPAAHVTLLTTATASSTAAVLSDAPEITVQPTTESVSCAATVGEVAGVGAGIGVPLLLAFLGALYLYLRERRRNRNGIIPDTTKAPENKDFLASEAPAAPLASITSSSGTSELPYANHYRELEGSPAPLATKYA